MANEVARSANGKLMIVSWTVYPETSGSSVIVSNIAQALGEDQVVLVGQSTSRRAKPWSSFSKVSLYHLDVLPFGVSTGQRFSRWLLLPRIVRRLRTIIKNEGVSQVLTIFPDELFCFAALQAAKAEGLPFHIWFHNSYLENRSGLFLRLAKRLQPKFFAAAGTVFVMSDGLNREMSRRYPDQPFVTLVHGFDLSPPRKDNRTFGENGVIRYLYSGSLNASCLDASLRQLRFLLSKPNSEIHIFSGNKSYFKSFGLEDERIIYHDFMPLDEFVQQLDQYDIMLLPHGLDGMRSEFEYRTIFPTRTIPLLISGKAIFAHSPPNAFLTEFLEENCCAEIVKTKEPAEMERSWQKLVNDTELRQHLIEKAQLTARQFQIDSVIEKLKSYVSI